VRWTCLESGEYTLEPSDRQKRGTDVIMHISEDGEEYLNESRLRDILEKYCSFMPVEIFFNVVKAEDETGKKDGDKKEPEEPKPVNDINPLWMRNPSDCSDEDYRAFYRKVFKDYREPLFWIHINADYPLNFKGILYFPKIDNEYESLEGQVKLFYNQVFVADNIKEVIPEFLLMLRGVIDCPELPLNVSRSYLQNSGYVAKISKHIVKKVADKLNSLFTNERENYEKLWRDLKIFVEYGSLREAKFYDRIKDSVVYELCGGTYKTLGEYLDGRDDKTVYYCNDKSEQASYISMLEAQGTEVLFLDRNLDNQFISMVERENKEVKFQRVDAAVSDALKEDGEEFSSDGLVELFRKVSGNDKLEVTFENLKDKILPELLTVSEEERRFGEMMKMYGMGADMKQPDGKLVLNSSCDVIRRLADAGDGGTTVARQIWSLAVMAQRRLTADEMKEFLARSYGMLDKLF
jgi:molecular chaperone HtpG